MILTWLLNLLRPRAVIILIAAGASLLGGLTVLVVAPARYLATARVTMDYIKPDPFTGKYMSNKGIEAYVVSQVQMVTDFQVTVPAVEAMGLLDNPDVLDAYNTRPANEQQIEFPQWAAGRMMSGATARVLPDSNMLQIEFRGTSPDVALSAVEALRVAYIEANSEIRRQSARAKAEVLVENSRVLRARIAKTEDAKLAYGRENGVSLSAASNDPDALALRRLATAVDKVVPGRVAPVSDTGAKLQDIESRIASAAATLGPNNPQLLAMERQRAALRSQLAAEQAALGSTGAAISARAAVRDQLLEEQKAKVLGNRDKLLQLRLFQDEIDRDAAELAKTLDDASTLRQMANANLATVTSIDDAKLQPQPIFPNKGLVLAGSGGLGLLVGLLLALLSELLARRIRSVRDLELAAPTPVLGVVPRLPKGGKAARTMRVRTRDRRGKAVEQVAA